MEKVILVRWCEIHLKGKNRGYFEKLLLTNVKKSLEQFNLKITMIQARLLIENFDENDEEEIVSCLKKVCGVHSFSICYLIPSNFEDIKNLSVELMKFKKGTFKVEAKRGDKSFPMNSMELGAELGYHILESNKNLVVDIHEPNYTLSVDIRTDNKTLVYLDVIKGVSGLPVGSSEKGLLLLSGGIDSPVAGYMMAKRGMKLSALHFHSYPYTSNAAKEKVIELGKMISKYSLGMDLFVVSVTHIQEEIHAKCPEEYMITILRRFMMRIAEKISNYNNCKAIITGENLGQVASQTVESMTSSNEVIELLPVFRPLVGFDKLDIIDISRKIGTYEESILPYEDCCTVFLPKYPLIKPKLDKVHEVESRLDVDGLIKEAMSTLERIRV